MNAYLFCFMLNLAAMFGMCLIAWFVWQGASPWLVLIADCSREHDHDKKTKANALYIAANSPDVVMDDIDEILRLRAQVERLEKEADWLALVLANAD